ncbi:sensor histidine kinase [Cyclobacterium sp. SYSU L10401]|uniref:sensor histidine kinase n=1 Tax=Cyclobacterium sp. SYSU L10401 TaxID=2678657 RepID=UPI0013D119E5|nr:histidine kinase [Cyclobacterium sp. SYSU L10401]
MKLNTKTLLPIALSVVLPLLGIYANTDTESIFNLGFIGNWMVGFITCYTLWYMLWELWRVKKPKYRALLVVLGILACIGVLNGFFFLFMTDGVENSLRAQSIVRIIFASIIFMIIQYALKTQENISRLLIEKEQIQKENYRVQLKALRKTVDPHFLFNSLNTLRSMVRQRHQHAEAFAMNLSDFYRQILRHDDNSTLPLSEELMVLESYLFLMKNRNEAAMQVKLGVDEKLHALHLPSMALQVVVENCFKHNSMTAKKPLTIEIVSTENGHIEVCNNLQPKIEEAESSGYGLDVLRKRYALLNEQDGVAIKEKDGHFLVQLKLLRR